MRGGVRTGHQHGLLQRASGKLYDASFYFFLVLRLIHLCCPCFEGSTTESHGADHTTPLLISWTNFEIGDSTRTNQLSSEILAASDYEDSVLNRDVLSRASISSSIPR